MALISVDGIVAGYGASEEILKCISLHADAGEIVSIIGPNGAGKSTLLKVIAGILKARRGSVTFAGTRIDTLPTRRITQRGVAISLAMCLPRPLPPPCSSSHPARRGPFRQTGHVP